MKKLEHDQIKTILGDDRICVSWDDFKDSEDYVDISFFREYVNLVTHDCKTRLCKILDIEPDAVFMHCKSWGNNVIFEADLNDDDYKTAMAYISKGRAAELDDMLVTVSAFLRLMTRFVETKGRACSEAEILELKTRTHALHFTLSGGIRFPGDLIDLLETEEGRDCRVWYDEEMNEYVLVPNRSVESMTYADIVAMTKSSIPLAKRTIRAIVERS